MINENDNNNKSKGRMIPTDIIVSHRLKNKRCIMGLSQQDLATAVGVSIQQIQKYERGTNRISAGKLYEFSKLLKITPNDFFTEIKEEEEIEDALKTNKVTETEMIRLIKVFGNLKGMVNKKTCNEIITLIRSLGESKKVSEEAI